MPKLSSKEFEKQGHSRETVHQLAGHVVEHPRLIEQVLLGEPAEADRGSDRNWTSEPRLKGEKRDAFIRRVLLGQVLHSGAAEGGS
jgi:hypothetical protein